MPRVVLPLQFEQNRGQFDSNVLFMARTGGLLLYLTQNETVFVMRPRSKTDHRAFLRPDRIRQGRERMEENESQTPLVVRMKLNGAKFSPHVQGEERLPGTVNYFIGNDRTEWRTHIPTYSKVRFTNVYEGVDLVYHSSGHDLEYDFELQPHANPKSIEMEFEGIDRMEFDGSGQVTMNAGKGSLKLHKPSVYQINAGQRQDIPSDFEFRGARKLGLRLQNYDPSKPIVIDPVLVYSSYVGGSGDDWADGLQLDSQGNVYIAGGTTSANFPATGTETPPSGTCVAFVTKLDPTATSILYSTFVGGTHGDSTCTWGDAAAEIDIDATGQAYIAGAALSHDFPVTANAFQSLMRSGATSNAFLSKLSPDGGLLLYSSFLGGESNDGAFSVKVDANQNAYLGGWAISSQFPVTSNALQTIRTSSSSSGNGFISRIDTRNAGVSSLIYSSYLGGSGDWGDAVYKIAVDSNQNAYLAGWTASTDFPVTSGSAFQPTASIGNWCGFVSRIDTSKPGSSSLAYSSFLCGTYSDWPGGIALDSSLNAYVSSEVFSQDFPTTVGPSNNRYPNDSMAAVTKVNTYALGVASLVFSTLVGGSDPAKTSWGDWTDGIVVDANGNAYLAGESSSTDYPVTLDAVQGTLKSSSGNGVLSVLSPDGSGLLYATYLGGSGGGQGDYIAEVKLDSNSNIWLAGNTESTDFPKTGGALQATYGGGEDAFIAELSALAVPHIAAVSPTMAIAGSMVTVNGSNFGDAIGSVTFGGVNASIQSWNSTLLTVQVPSSLSPGFAAVVVTTALEASNVVGFVVIPAPLTITASSASGEVGVPYSASMIATGGTAPYSWSIISGILPSGLALDSTKGQISGTPTSSGTFSFTLQAKDSGTSGLTARQMVSITVMLGPVSPTITPSAVSGTVEPGHPAIFRLGFQGVAADANAVFNIVCQGLPRGTACSYTPNHFTLDAKGFGTAVLTITTTGPAPTDTISTNLKIFSILACLLVAPGVVGTLLIGSRKKQNCPLVLIFLLGALLAGNFSCGKTISQPAFGCENCTPAGTSTVRVVATSQYPALQSFVTLHVRVGPTAQ